MTHNFDAHSPQGSRPPAGAQKKIQTSNWDRGKKQGEKPLGGHGNVMKQMLDTKYTESLRTKFWGKKTRARTCSDTPSRRIAAGKPQIHHARSVSGSRPLCPVVLPIGPPINTAFRTFRPPNHEESATPRNLRPPNTCTVKNPYAIFLLPDGDECKTQFFGREMKRSENGPPAPPNTNTNRVADVSYTKPKQKKNAHMSNKK